MNQLWNDFALRAGFALDEPRQQLLLRYLDLLMAGNEKMNLTRITERATAEVQHVGDALTVLPLLPPGEHDLADVGTGGGVPGIPLAIVRPDISVTLIEATKKKAVFLRETVAALGLANVAVVDLRAEEAGHSALREKFDVAVARAVGTMDWLAEWCLPLVKVHGVALAMKGQKARVLEELKDAGAVIRAAGGSVPTIQEVELPGAEHRVIVVLKKVRHSDRRLPRPASIAKGTPFAQKMEARQQK